MKNSTLCYITRGDSVLMLYRNKKKNDANGGKWIGVGGKFEENESPQDCLLREVREETGLTLTSYRLAGIVTFVSDTWETEQMFLFTADGFEGELTSCDEGELHWKERESILALPLWEGDKIFLRLLSEEHDFFLLKLCYRGDILTKAILDGENLTL